MYHLFMIGWLQLTIMYVVTFVSLPNTVVSSIDVFDFGNVN